MKNDMINLDELPLDMQEYIYSFLTPEDLANVRLVNRASRRATNMGWQKPKQQYLHNKMINQLENEGPFRLRPSVPGPIQSGKMLAPVDELPYIGIEYKGRQQPYRGNMDILGYPGGTQFWEKAINQTSNKIKDRIFRDPQRDTYREATQIVNEQHKPRWRRLFTKKRKTRKPTTRRKSTTRKPTTRKSTTRRKPRKTTLSRRR